VDLAAKRTAKGASVLVTFDADVRERALLREAVGAGTSLMFLEDLTGDRRSAALEGAEALISWNVAKELRNEDWPLLEGLGLLQLISAGADHLPFADVPPGTLIAANAGAYAQPMAEHVLALTLALAKRLCIQHGELQRGRFDQSTPNRMLAGEACAILGFGGVGRATARLARAFGMRILAINRRGRSEETIDFIGTMADLEYVLRSAYVVVVALPLTAATRGLIGQRELEWMASDAILINVARAAIVLDDALYQHLLAHPRFMAGLDAWWVEPFSQDTFRLDHPFLELPNVLGSPHNSGVVPGSLAVGMRRAAENVRRYLKGARPAGLVDRKDYLS
jgi:phosphoglycerate dehydrogenase-like enzyme